MSDNEGLILFDAISEDDPEAVIEIPNDGSMTTVLQTAVLFAKLDEQIKAKEDEVKALKKQRRLIEERTRDLFLTNGKTSAIKTATRTLFLKKQTYPAYRNGATNELVCEQLTQAGLGWLVQKRFNSERLAALMKEIEEHKEDFATLYPALAQCIQPVTSYQVQTRARNT